MTYREPDPSATREQLRHQLSLREDEIDSLRNQVARLTSDIIQRDAKPRRPVGVWIAWALLVPTTLVFLGRMGTALVGYAMGAYGFDGWCYAGATVAVAAAIVSAVGLLIHYFDEPEKKR